MALREVAANWKKSQPKAALSLLEKALQLVSFIPEGASKNQVAAELAAEAASVDKEWTLRWISQVPDPSLRDLLCKGAGNFWAAEDPVYKFKVAGICDIDQKRLDDAAAKLGNPETGTDAAALAKKVKPDVFCLHDAAPAHSFHQGGGRRWREAGCV